MGVKLILYEFRKLTVKKCTNSFGVAGTECEGTHLQGLSHCLLLQRPLPGGRREAEGRAGPGRSLGRRGEAAGLAGHAHLHVPKRSLVTGSRPVRLGCILTKPFWPRVMDSSPDRLSNGWGLMYSLSPVKAPDGHARDC